MLAGNVIDLFSARLGGQFNRNALRAEIRVAVNEIYSLPGVSWGRRESYTELLTTAGQFVYEAEGRKASRIFRRHSLNPYKSVRYPAGDRFAESEDIAFRCVEAFSPTEPVFKVIFDEQFDPNGETFLMEVYDFPMQVTADSVEVPLPEQWITTLLYYAVKRRVEESAYGVDIYSAPEVQRLLGQLIGSEAILNENVSRTRLRF